MFSGSGLTDVPIFTCDS